MGKKTKLTKERSCEEEKSRKYQVISTSLSESSCWNPYFARNQSCAQTRASRVSGLSWISESPRTWPPVKKADSEEIDVIGIIKTDFANLAKVGNQSRLMHHQLSISKDRE